MIADDDNDDGDEGEVLHAFNICTKRLLNIILTLNKHFNGFFWTDDDDDDDEDEG